MRNNNNIAKSFIIDVNWDCNLKCKMCVKRTLDKGYGQRPFEDFKKLVEKLPFAKAIKMGALGDPFSYKEIGELLRYLKNKGVQLPLTTNITQITKENLKKIPQGTPLFMSIDSGTPDTYKTIRGKDLEKTKDIVRMVRKERPDIYIGFNYLMFNFNMDEDARKAIDFAKEVNASITFFYPIYFTKEIEEKWNLQRDPLYVVKLMEVAKYAEDSKVQYFISSPYTEERKCMRGFAEPIIAYNGNVYPCDYCYQNMNDYGKWTSHGKDVDVEVPQDEYCMGNLYEEDFVDIWNKPEYIQFREQLAELNAYGTGMSFKKTLESLDGSPYEHCKVCMARWNRCL